MLSDLRQGLAKPAGASRERHRRGRQPRRSRSVPAIVAVVDRTLLSPLPFPEPDTLVVEG
jgi:hypothetical protein